MQRAFGRAAAEMLKQRLVEIAGAPDLEGLQTIPGLNELRTNDDGVFVVPVADSVEILCTVAAASQEAGISHGPLVTIVDVRAPRG